MNSNILEKQVVKTKNNLKIIGIIVGVIIIIGIIITVIYFATKKNPTSNPADTESKKVLGGSCNVTSDCDEKLICDNKICKTFCRQNSDCSGGRVCSSNNACVIAQSSNSCSSNQDCKSGKVCNNGTCVDYSGCTTDSDCASNSLAKKCNNGTCVQCISDTNCSNTQKCNNGTCVTRGTIDTGPKMYRLLTTHGFVGETGLNVDIRNVPDATLADCKVACDSESSCKGFTRTTNLEDNDRGECILKSGPNDNNKLYSNALASEYSGAINSWVKIDKYDSFIPATGATSNTYLKSNNQYINDKYNLSQVTGTLSKCIQDCNKNTSCRGFNRLKNFSDTDSSGTCYLKSTNVATDVNMTSNPNQYNSWVNISVPEQVVSGGNIGCSGEKFCGQDWNNEFPYSWGGSRCVGIIQDGKVNAEKCGETFGGNISAICQRDDKLGFLQRSGKGCNNNDLNRTAITGSSVDNTQDNSSYDYYKKANNIADRILKIKTNEPKSGGLAGSPDKGMKCNDWCGSTGYAYYATGQNEFARDLQNSWKNTNDNKCLSAPAVKNSGEKEIRTCDERLDSDYTKSCVCLKRV